MTKLEALEKIRKLPKLKSGYKYIVHDDGAVLIVNKDDKLQRWLHREFGDFVLNVICDPIEYYSSYFIKPITKTLEIEVIVGYE